MVDINKKVNPNVEKEVLSNKEQIRQEAESGLAGEIPVPERREKIAAEEKLISAELRKEIEMMELDDKSKAEAEKKAEKIEFLGEKEKIEHLLEIARTKGVVFAIQVARKTNEPYLLDILHDMLAKEGYYKDFTK